MTAVAIAPVDARTRDRLQRELRSVPGLSVLDMADAHPRAALKDWVGRHPATAVIALVEDADDALEALQAGAAAVLPRAADLREITNAIEAARNGLAVIPRDVLTTLLDPRSWEEALPVDVTAGAVALTPRELDVLKALADGASNKAIARRLGISFHTVKFHVAAILAKLDADSRTEAVAKAAHLGLVML
jgi:DNA-binding NarL/FixJ family response regulator